MTKSNSEILKIVIFASFFSIGTWLVFKGFIGIFGLENLPYFWSIILGLVVVFISVKLGLNKFKLN